MISSISPCVYICTYIIYSYNVDIIYIAIIVENKLSRDTYTWEEIIMLLASQEKSNVKAGKIRRYKIKEVLREKLL